MAFRIIAVSVLALLSGLAIADEPKHSNPQPTAPFCQNQCGIDPTTGNMRCYWVCTY